MLDTIISPVIKASVIINKDLHLTIHIGQTKIDQLDGSLLDFAQGAGIGVFSHLFSFYLHAGPLTTHFDGEVEAIHIALQQLAVRLPPLERAVILSDSTSALQALSNYNENNCLRVQNCRELLGKIKGKIVFQWVPSHCGLWGNERADFLAKGNGFFRVARDKPWSTLCKKSHGIPSSPRAAAVAKFRLLTGHDCLCAHLFRFNLVTSPICVLYDTGQDMTAAHLDECSALNDLNCIVKRKYSQEYLNFGFTITEVNGEEKPLCVICSEILAAASMKPNKLKRHFETLPARCKKPHTIAEELILPAAIEIVETMFGDNFAKELQSIPLSNDTVSRRIDDIAWLKM
ncbi:uncharacterized protein LOC103524116 [Trichonephila clavipes]|nr:uncharacterized protein LOC103524116 [Trichonephila clavipes]